MFNYLGFWGFGVLGFWGFRLESVPARPFWGTAARNTGWAAELKNNCHLLKISLELRCFSLKLLRSGKCPGAALTPGVDAPRRLLCKARSIDIRSRWRLKAVKDCTQVPKVHPFAQSRFLVPLNVQSLRLSLQKTSKDGERN